jgi:heme exporter protein CcmD
MGGYAGFVWPAYGITVIALGAAIALTLRAYVRAKTMLGRIEDETAR